MEWTSNGPRSNLESGLVPGGRSVLKADERWVEFVVRALDQDHGTSRLAMVAGLLCRARQAGENGLETASRELQSLLDRSPDEECGPASDVLTTGYHVWLFYGLRFSGEIEITEKVKAVPLEQTEAFLDMDVVRNIAPPNARGNGWEGVGAILQAVPWRPVLFPPEDQTERVHDIGSFCIDARDFVQLLSVFQGAPMVSLAFFPDRTHRTVPLLLGNPRLSGSMGVDPWARAFVSLGKPRELDDDALEQARRLFSEPEPERSRYREYGRVISRLSEALARSGDYADDDKILDVAIALEQMYELDQGEISFKLRIRAACFLESETQSRLCVFKKVGQLYDGRSGIVHSRRKEPSRESKEEAFENGFDVARASVTKLLREGPPRDWNEVVMAGVGNRNQ